MEGTLALLFGLVGAFLVWATPLAWLKAAGGLLLVLTLGSIALDLLRLIAG